MHFLFVLALTVAATVLPAYAEVEVDMELVLAVDVSRSMSPAELEIQRRGYASALTSPEVLRAIRSGPLGRIGVTYVEWAGSGSQRIIADWTMIETAEDAAAFSRQITANFEPSLRRTSISGAVLFGIERLGESPFLSFREVIDISGDGPNNQGLPAPEARDLAVAAGITINGLPLMTRDGLGSAWHLEDLDAYYRACVIGGPGAFVVPVRDWSQFAAAVRRKLVLEISGLAADGLRAAQFAAGGYDCLIGEKIWEQNRGGWGLP